jgi:hypothetical protein
MGPAECSPRRSMALGIAARTQNLSIVIAGRDPAIHAENLLAQSLRAAYTPDVTMDHRVKPGGDAVGFVWSILYVKCRVVRLFDAFHKMSRKYMPLYVVEVQLRYNNRFNPDMFGTAIGGW